MGLLFLNIFWWLMNRPVDAGVVLSSTLGTQPRVGDPIQLECESDTAGSVWKWMRGERKISSDPPYITIDTGDGVIEYLNIKSAVRDDAGTYWCRVDLEESNRVSLVVIPPAPKFTSVLSNVTKYATQSITMTVTIETLGKFSMTVVWYHLRDGSRKIVNTSFYFDVYGKVNNSYHISTLRVEDGGQYIVSIESAYYSHVETSTWLMIIGRPASPKNVRAINSDLDLVEVSWEHPQHRANSDLIERYKVQIRVDRNMTWHLHPDIEVTSTTYAIENILPCSLVFVEVASEGKFLSSDWSRAKPYPLRSALRKPVNADFIIYTEANVVTFTYQGKKHILALTESQDELDDNFCALLTRTAKNSSSLPPATLPDNRCIFITPARGPSIKSVRDTVSQCPTYGMCSMEQRASTLCHLGGRRIRPDDNDGEDPLIEDENGGGLPKWALALIIVTAVVVAGIIVVVAIVVLCKRWKKNKESRNHDPVPMRDQPNANLVRYTPTDQYDIARGQRTPHLTDETQTTASNDVHRLHSLDTDPSTQVPSTRGMSSRRSAGEDNTSAETTVAVPSSPGRRRSEGEDDTAAETTVAVPSASGLSILNDRQIDEQASRIQADASADHSVTVHSSSNGSTASVPRHTTVNYQHGDGTYQSKLDVIQKTVGELGTMIVETREEEEQVFQRVVQQLQNRLDLIQRELEEGRQESNRQNADLLHQLADTRQELVGYASQIHNIAIDTNTAVQNEATSGRNMNEESQEVAASQDFKETQRSDVAVADSPPVSSHPSSVKLSSKVSYQDIGNIASLGSTTVAASGQQQDLESTFVAIKLCGKHKWYEIGRALGFKSEELTAMNSCLGTSVMQAVIDKTRARYGDEDAARKLLRVCKHVGIHGAVMDELGIQHSEVTSSAESPTGESEML